MGVSILQLQTISYMAERIVGTGSFGIVFQVTNQFHLLAFFKLRCYYFSLDNFEKFHIGKMLGDGGDCCYKEGVTG